MRQGRNISDLAIELQRQLATKEDFVADTRRMQFSSSKAVPSAPVLTQLTLDDARPDGLGVFPVTAYAHGQVADRLGIPKRYYDRLRDEAPVLLDTNVNHWFQNEPEKRLVRTLDGRARAFLSNRYHRIDNYEIAEVVLPILGGVPDMKIASCELTEARMYIKATFPRIQGEVKKGDTLQAGLVLTNSEVGAGAFSIAPFTVRLICANGMTHTGFGQRRTHLGSQLDEGVIFGPDTLRAVDAAFKLEVRDIVKQVANQQAFDQLVDSLRHLTEFKVAGSPPDVVEKLAQRHGLTDTERDGVLWHLIDGGDLSGWGYCNAVTRAANDVEDYDRASDLERLGGTLAAAPDKEWQALAVAA
jgi:hypothetical protein